MGRRSRAVTDRGRCQAAAAAPTRRISTHKRVQGVGGPRAVQFHFYSTLALSTAACGPRNRAVSLQPLPERKLSSRRPQRPQEERESGSRSAPEPFGVTRRALAAAIDGSRGPRVRDRAAGSGKCAASEREAGRSDWVLLWAAPLRRCSFHGRSVL